MLDPVSIHQDEVSSAGSPLEDAPSELLPDQPESGETQFSGLALSTGVQQAVVTSGYAQPTPIQLQIIPQMLSGRDVLAQSQTGTGKTAAFALPILSRIEQASDRFGALPRALVLTPTRELAIQVAKSFSTYAAFIPEFAVATIYGGQDYEPQLKQLRRCPQVVVGTPGRVIDHVRRGTLDLSEVEWLVLDEGDEMLNMGFLEDVLFVLDRTPSTRQTSLFSATLPEPIQQIASKHLKDPVKIAIKNETLTAESIRQRAVFVSPRNRLDMLKRFIEVEPTDGVIVFAKTKDSTVTIANKLGRDGFSVVALNGDMPQRTRERTIDSFRKGHIDILVATDVAARGLDVTRVSHVFNFDLPHDSQSYIHRIGRTGRAGRPGEAFIFLADGQKGKLRMIERATKQKIQVVSPPSIEEINANRVADFCKQIDDVTTARDLTMFRALITEYAKESGKPMDVIAAALAQIAQRGQPFLATELPKSDRPEKRAQSRSREDRKGFDRRSGRDDDRPPRRIGPPRAGKVRYRIEVGRQNGVQPGNIVGAIANEAGIDGESIGPIKINDSFSTVDLPEGMPQDIFETLRETKIVGKRLDLSIDGGRREMPRKRTDERGGPPHRKKRHGGKDFSRGKSFTKKKTLANVKAKKRKSKPKVRVT